VQRRRVVERRRAGLLETPAANRSIRSSTVSAHGLERHLDRRLFHQAIDNAERRGLLLPGERDLLEAETA